MKASLINRSRMLRAVVIGLCCLASMVSLRSQEKKGSPDKNWVNLISNLPGRLGVGRMEWTVTRRILPDTELSQVLKSNLDKQIVQAEGEEEIRSLRNKNAQLIENVEAGEVIHMSINLSYQHREKFHIEHIFKTDEGDAVFDYYADDDGVIYGVEPRNREVRLLSPKRADILSELARGIPELGCAKWLVGLEKLRNVGAKGDVLLFEGKHRKTGGLVKIGFDKVKLQLTSLEVFTRKGKHKQFEVLVTDVEVEGGYPFPKEVVYRSMKNGKLKIEETWKLKAFRFTKDLSDLHSTQYSLEPRYIVSDETGPTVRQFLSNEVLEKKDRRKK